MFKNRFKSKKSKSSTVKSKGERLGWVSVKNAEPVRLRSVLSDGEVVNVQNAHPLLVP